MLIAEYPLKCSNISPISGRLKLRHSQKIFIRKLRKGYHIHYMFSLWCRILADGSLLLRLIWTYCVKISTFPRLHLLYFAQAQNQNYNSVTSDFLLSNLILENRFMIIIWNVFDISLSNLIQFTTVINKADYDWYDIYKHFSHLFM